jgi:hypothetical protein
MGSDSRLWCVGSDWIFATDALGTLHFRRFRRRPPRIFDQQVCSVAQLTLIGRHKSVTRCSRVSTRIDSDQGNIRQHWFKRERKWPGLRAAARRDLETAREKRVDVSKYEFAFRNARLDERRAVSLLEAHNKDHGCQPAWF